MTFLISKLINSFIQENVSFLVILVELEYCTICRHARKIGDTNFFVPLIQTIIIPHRLGFDPRARD
jgi:hypothetical protein